jgi:FtsP/CotA-like multicopper oxidase with cupredoxin domain
MKIKPVVAAIAVGAAMFGSLPSGAQPTGPRAQICDSPTDSMNLFAEDLGRGRIGYGLTPDRATIPGPTITMTEGDCLAVTLVNDANEKLSLHFHGVLYTAASDGTPLNTSCVAPGRSRTFVLKATAPSTRADGTIDPGTAGYWHYHDHCLGSRHGTAGIQAGLFGALIVRRPGDLVPDRDPFVLTMGPGLTINKRKAPRTPLLEANEGDRVEFVVIGEGDPLHTFHLHGHRWTDTRTGEVTEPSNDVAIIDNRTVGPADSFGFQIIAGEGVGPGAWMYHCHVQNHSDRGMAGIFLVRTADGQITAEAAAALRRFRRHEKHHGA